MITIDEFKKLEVRIGTIVEAQRIEGADRLLKLVVDMGGQQRQILAGIAKWYPQPQELVGIQVPVLVNLEPRRMRGLESQGMMLAADENGTPVLLHPSRPVAPGSAVR